MNALSEASRVRRRTLLGALCASACATILPLARAHGQARALPLKNLGLEHLDIVVPDPAESARFYKRVFSSPLHEQDFRGGKRYFVLLGDLPPDRQVGYVAIGAANGRPIAVGHYCALAESADLEAIAKELAAAGYPQPGGGFGMIPDPDGLELQLFKPPAGLVTAAVPSTLEVTRDGIFAPLGLEHVLLAVSDLERAQRYYRFVYGEGIETRDPVARNAYGSSSRVIRESVSSRLPKAECHASCASESRWLPLTARESRHACEQLAPNCSR